ncbi:MAG: hypothetical protein WAL32_18500, partial [Terriglobales bacterium]
MRAPRALLLVCALCLSVELFGQQNCPLPPSLTPIPAGENIFTEQQEVYLGDVMAEHISQNVTVLHDDALTAHLQQLGDRLLRYLPESKLRFQFMLVDLPEP